MKSSSVNQKMLIDVLPPAIVAASGCGSVKVSRMSIAVMMACMATIHQRLVFTTSTMGLQMPLRNHGKYNSVVKNDMSPLGTPILVNIITEILLTTK